MGGFAYKVATAVIPVALVAAGCSSGSSGSAGTTSAAAPPATSASAPAASSAPSSAAPQGAKAVTATEKEFSITLSTTTFSAGAYTFTVHNTGTLPHNLTVQGPGVDKTASPTLMPGQTGTVSVTFQKGSYELWCSVDSHKEQGMDMMIQVS
jgi:uncharacterized cupredoxin-like copper-binding protein